MAALRHKKTAKRKVGGTAEHEYNAVGAPETKEAKDREDSFNKGGKVKKKAGGHVEHEKSAHRADKKPRRAMGGSVLSHASKKEVAKEDAAGQGHQADGPKGEDMERVRYRKGGKAK